MKCPKCDRDLPEGAAFCAYCGRRITPAPRKRKRRTSGSGNISKLSGKRAKPYLARLDGVTVGTFATVREAELALSRLCDATVTDKFNWTFQQVYDAWYPEHEAVLLARAQVRGSGSTSMEGYTHAVKHCAALCSRPFRSIRKGELQAVLNAMRDKGYSPSTAEKVKLLFSQLYQWAIAEHITQANLSNTLVVHPRTKADPQLFTADEIRRIIECGLPGAPVAVILLATGCRIGELFSARTEDCFDDYFVSGSKTAAGIARAIPVAPFGLPAYRAMRGAALERGAELLIGGYDGNRAPANYRKREYYAMLDALGIDRAKTPHKARHTFATAAVAAQVRPEALKGMLGHASYTTTIDLYTHQPSAQLLEEVKKINLP